MKRILRGSTRIFILALLLTCGIGVLNSQPLAPRFTHLVIDDGLSQGAVGCIIQDRKGYMWFGTKDGLNRYDGYRFSIFKHDPSDLASLSDNAAMIHEDRAGRLWVGTPRMLNQFDQTTESFRRIDLGEKGSSGDHSGQNAINCICGDEQGKLWVGTAEGLVRYNPADGSFARYRADPRDAESLSGDNIRALLLDRSGVLWIGTLAGLDRINLRTNGPSVGGRIKPRFEHFTMRGAGYHGLTVDLIVSLFESRDSAIWIGTHAGLFRQNRTERAAGRFRFFPHATGAYAEPWRARITGMCEDLAGRIWFATPGHLGIFDPRTERYQYLSHDPRESGSISYNAILSVCADRSGKIWVGTNGKGIDIHDQHARRFSLFTGNADRPPFRTELSIHSILEDSDGSIWFAVNYLLCRLNRNTGACDTIPLRAEIYDLLLDRRNFLWIGTNLGLYRYAPDRRTRVLYTADPQRPGTLPEVPVRRLIEDKAGEVWCIAGHHLCRYGRERDRFESYLPLPGGRDDVTSLCESRPGLFWIGLADGGLLRYEPAGGKTIHYHHSPADSASLSMENVKCLLPDPRDPERTLWVGTAGGGLNRLDIQTGRFTRVTEKEGLPNNYIYGILADEWKHLWISSNRGLCRFNPALTGGKAFRTYLGTDGLQSNEFNSDSYHKGRSGELYFGGVNGLTWFFPSEIADNPYIPPIVFTDFLLLDRRVKFGTPDSPLRKPIGVTDTVILPSRENVFSIEFAALDFSRRGENLYAYRMEGFHDKWVQAGTHRMATFTNLDPGEYTFRVRGSNGDGVWNEQGAALHIIILPPWWRTRTAYGIYLVLLLAGVFVVDRFQRRRTIVRERAGAQMREAELRAVAAESQAKALQAENERRRSELARAEEFALIDDIVRGINKEFDLERLLQALLQHGMKLLPDAEKASILLLNREMREFTIAASIGYDPTTIRGICIPEEEMIRRYTGTSQEVGKGVYILKHLSDLPGEEALSGLPRAASLLIMAVEWEGTLRGYLVFDNLTASEAFDETDARRLKLLQEHAVAAIAKADSIHILQEKNQEILRTQEQLITQEKLASLGALTAGIAHEIKNPLNFVNNFSQFSIELVDELRAKLEPAEGSPASERAQSAGRILDELELYAKKINEHGVRADAIIRSMLQHSRAKAGERQKTNVNALLEENLNLAYHGMRAQFPGFNAAIERNFDPSMPPIPAVPQDISRVFLNIITNGFYAVYRKKMETGDADGFAPALSLRTRNAVDGIEVRIRDNGGGIPIAVHKKIFTPFFTTKPAGQGTGLGLSLSHDIIVKGHHGEIRFESEEGSFTEFIITIPRQDATAPQST